MKSKNPPQNQADHPFFEEGRGRERSKGKGSRRMVLRRELIFGSFARIKTSQRN